MSVETCRGASRGYVTLLAPKKQGKYAGVTDFWGLFQIC